ncbi:MAG: CHAT domain-containing protein [Acidobacteriota bacterium]|nr:CHAT domain-containing protein [Acidobacteriota bacterium]
MKAVFNFPIKLFFCLFVCLSDCAFLSAQILEQSTAEQSAVSAESEARQSGFMWNRAETERSFQLYLETAEKWKRLNKPENTAACFRKAGRQATMLGNKEKAFQLFNDALKITGGNNYSDERIKILGELSLLAFENGRIADSKKHFENALQLAKTSTNASAKAAAFFSAAEFHYFQDNLKTAVDFYRQAIDLSKQAGDTPNEAKALVNLAYLYLQQYEYAVSLETFNLALAKWNETGDRRGEAVTLKAIGTAYSFMNEKQKALEYYKKAETLFPDDIDFKEKAILYNDIGTIYDYYEDWKLAFDYRQKALTLFERDNYLYGQMATLPSLGKLAFIKGEKEAALNYFAQAEKLAVKIKDNYFLAITKEELGTFYYEQNDYENALLNFQKSLSLLQPQKHKRQTSQLFNKTGQIYKHRNDLPTARKYFSDSLKLNRDVKDKFTEAETLYNLAGIEADDENALKLLKDSVEITESVYSDVLNSKLKRNYFSNVFNRYELYINRLMKMHRRFPEKGFDALALQAAEKARARSMLENLRLSEANFSKDADPETLRREKEVRNLYSVKAGKLTDALSRNAEQPEIQKLADEIGALENELEQIKSDLKQNSPIYSAIKNPAPFNTTDFQNRVLDDKTLLLEFSFGKDESFLWLIGKDYAESYVLPTREQIESRVESLRKLIDSRSMLEGESIENYLARLASTETEYTREAQIFSNELLGQIADKIREKRLIIVPDGKLHYFPISALPFPHTTNNQPILLTNETVYEPSASMLALLSQTEKQKSAATKNLLVFSDPIFSNQDERIADEFRNQSAPEKSSAKNEKLRFAGSLTSLSRLNASQTEADSIVRIVGDSASTAFSGAAANREQFLSQSASDYKIIHFATHGWIDEEHPELSGIVLSQLTENGEPRNGVVRLHDIYGMNLAADLIVLSACETGVGKEVKGEGLVSLNNAFMQVGAKSVLSSLWKIDDYAAVELMENFYKSLADDNLSAAQALRQAQIKLRQNPRYQSPFYWAAFTVQGDFHKSVKVNKPFTFDYRWLFAILFLISAFLLAIKHRKKFTETRTK